MDPAHADEGDYRNDPYLRCEDRCSHDLARGVTVVELLGTDGPYPAGHVVVSFNRARALMLRTATAHLADTA